MQFAKNHPKNKIAASIWSCRSVSIYYGTLSALRTLSVPSLVGEAFSHMRKAQNTAKMHSDMNPAAPGRIAKGIRFSATALRNERVDASAIMLRNERCLAEAVRISFVSRDCHHEGRRRLDTKHS